MLHSVNTNVTDLHPALTDRGRSTMTEGSTVMITPSRHPTHTTIRTNRFRHVVAVAVAIWACATFMTESSAAEKQTPLNVQDGNDISIEYTLSTKDGGTIDSNVGKKVFTYTQGSKHILPGMQKQLAGLKVGDKKSMDLQPDEAYGPIDPKAIEEVDLSMVPEEARKVGQYIQSEGPHGTVIRAKVQEIKEKTIVLDFNHPLAGKALHFDVKIVNITKGDTTASKPPASEPYQQ